MNFFLQLKLLIWKNFLLRKRQKIRCVVELIWPLFLFSILMWVRTRGLRQYVHECHFQEKAMPSAGQLPFLQSFLCGFNNTCYARIKDTKYTLDDYNNSIFAQFVNDVETLLSNTTTLEKLQGVQVLNEDIRDLSSLIRSIAARQKSFKGSIHLNNLITNTNKLKIFSKEKHIQLSNNTLDSIFNSKINVGNISMSHFLILRNDPKSLICNKTFILQFIELQEPNNIDNIVKELCNISNSDFSSIFSEIKNEIDGKSLLNEVTNLVELNMGRSFNWNQWEELDHLSRQLATNLTRMEAYHHLLKSSAAVGETYRKLMSLSTEYNVSTMYSYLMIAQHFICGHSIDEIIESLKSEEEKIDRLDSVRDQLNNINKQKYDYENDTEASEMCNEWFKALEENPISRLIWLQFKIFFRGKILFAPDTPVTRRIMQRINATFDSLQSIKDLSKHWINFTLPLLQQQLVNNESNMKYIQQFADSSFGEQLMLMSLNNSYVKSFFAGDNGKEAKYAKDLVGRLLDKNDSTYREEAFNIFSEAQMNFSLILECFDLNKTEAFATEEAAIQRGMKLLEKGKLWAVVSFLNLDLQNKDTLSPFVTYKIRMDSDRVDNTRMIEDRLNRPGPRRRVPIDMKYISYGFAYLQDMIDQSIIIDQTHNNDTPGIFLKQFPYPCYIVDTFVLAISRTFPMFMTLSWVYSCSMIIKSIVYEKEHRLKETMRMMGLGNAVHWAGWFLDSLVPMLLTITMLTCILVYGKVLERSDPTVVFVFLLIYCITTITKSFLISVFFSRANLAAAAGGIIFFIMYLPYPFMVIWEQRISTNPKVISSLLSNVAFGFGCSYFAHYEEAGIGIHWKNVGESPIIDDGYNLQYVMCMLGLDAVLYSALTWYIEVVFPGQYGVPKPWYFPFMKSYWCGSQSKVESTENLNLLNHDFLIPENFESDPLHLTLGVSLCNLGKEYGNGKVAVQDLNLNFYQDQITSFLGHNGAGKTTTISILTGLFRPTSGTAQIYGLDIRRDMDSIRKSLGMCPQHNVLFDHLSVEEHLWFYALLKGHPAEEVQVEAEQMLKDLGLPHKRKSLACELSGGMQRKLSIAVAFIGGSKTVILDEPTSGVDPYSRRSIWELLVKYKQGRTVILTTHFMDEADLLGDRIAIIANGKLQCCGSSLFLKSRFGSGYYLTIECSEATTTQLNTSNADSDVEDVCILRGDEANTNPRELDHSSVTGITQLIQRYITTATLHQSMGSELVYILPHRNNVESFEELFHGLDAAMNSLGISSYGISDTTLEEIFIQVAEQADTTLNCAVSGMQPATGNKFLRKFKKPTFKHLDCANMFKSRSKHECNVESNHAIPDSAKKQIVIHVKGSSVKYLNVATTTELPEIHASGSKSDSVKLHWNQFKALNIKRFHHTKRNPKALFCELVVPAVFVCMSLGFTVIIPKLMMPPPLTLEPWLYGPPNYVFFSDDNPLKTGADNYEAELIGPIGMGTRCVLENDVRDEFCKPVNVSGKLNPLTLPPLTSPECSCSLGTPQCPVGAGGPSPPSAVVSTGDIMQNMTGRNISDWLVKTEAHYYKKRYGGFSFGVSNRWQAFNMSHALSLLSEIYGAGVPKDPESLKHLSEYVKGFENNEAAPSNIRVWYNNKGWAASVSYLNAINNMVLRELLPAGEDVERFGIRVINHPMNFTESQLTDELIQQSGISLLHAISVIFALSFVPASFVVFLIEERVSNAKHLQFVSGVNRLVYWFAAFFWDYASYMLAAFLCILVFLIFNEQAYVSSTNIPGLILLLLLYGWSSVPLMYPASFLFDIPSSAFVALACANLFIGIVTTVATFVLEIFDDAELQYIASIIREVFLVFPHFCLGQGLMNMATHHLAAKALSSYGMELEINIFEWGFLGKNLACMTVAGIIFFLINLGIEYQVFNIFSSEMELQLESPEDEEDVLVERQRVENRNPGNEVLLLKNLTKVYRNGHTAVNQVCIGVKKGECFGLLGLNGAGKTSTFKMMTGDEKVSGGDAFVAGLSVRHHMDQVRLHLGYCPQFDALDPLLTVREHLQLYSRLRGLPASTQHLSVAEHIQRLGLTHYADRLAGTLSGGNKRKLSTAIALTGNPPLIFLDEPTSGMDPKARRFLWTCIRDVVAEGRSVVLTSHSMEECEALCTKLTIMVNGRFKCLGSCQHLKNKFGRGYSLVVRCSPESVEAVTAYIATHLPAARLRETHHNQLQFQLPQESLQLAHVFQAMQQARQSNLVLDYSLSQTTLEEVFIRFANEQKEEANINRDPFSLSHCLFCCKRCNAQTS